MIVSHIGLVVFVTEYALENRVVGGINMAVIAVIPFFPMFAGIDREILRVVIPIRRDPCCRRVTGLAIGREVCRRMIRAGGAIISTLMARETLRGCRDIATRMTGDTHESDMSARKWEIRRAVIESRRRPGCGRVTFSA